MTEVPPWVKLGFDFAIDWQASFREFCIAHGGDPVPWGPRMLMPDGWAYALDHRGPEYAPPDDPDEAKKLVLTYWIERRKLIRSQFNELQGIVENLEGLLMTRSHRIVMVKQSWGEGPGGEPVPVFEQEPLTREALEPMVERLKELKGMELEAERTISKLKSEGVEHVDVDAQGRPDDQAQAARGPHRAAGAGRR